MILFDETARDTVGDGRTVPDFLISKGIVPGIKVDKGLEKVTGMDASNYAYNHTNRDDFIAKLSIEEAQSLLSPVLDIVNIQKCVIPNKWTGESDAYEFECKWNEYTYFVYISSVNGDELNIVRLVDTTSGELAQ